MASAITKAGWYKFTLAGMNFYFKQDPKIRIEGGWQKIDVAGLEGAFLEAVNTGHTVKFTLDIYDTASGVNFSAVRSALNPDLSVLTAGAFATDNKLSWSIVKVHGDGASALSMMTGYCLPLNMDYVLANKEGHHSEVEFVDVRVAPSITS